MATNNCSKENDRDQSVNQKISHETSDGTCSSGAFFDNLAWLTTEETARYLRKNVNAIRILVYRRILRARKFRRRLYFKREELEMLIETSQHMGG